MIAIQCSYQYNVVCQSGWYHKLPPLSEMERIEQSLLSEKLDEILDRIDNEDIGFVITENGLPKVVIVPFRWFAENFPDEVPDGL